jgi:hypothetical protein
MKKKSIFFVPVLLIIFLWMLNLSSCNDNSITIQQIEGFDSARYNIKHSIESLGYYSYIIDSNNIFLGYFSNLLYIKDTSYLYLNYGDNFCCLYMGGRNNEIYFVGHSFGEQVGFEKPRLKKWTGMYFQEIPIIDTTNKYYYLTFVYLSTNDGLFLGGNKGNILRYYNGEFTKFQFDTTFRLCKFFQDEQYSLYCWEYKDSANSLGNWIKIFQNFYKFKNNSWDLVYTYTTIIDSTESKNIWPCQVGNEILAMGNDGIYKFDGVSYKIIMNISCFHPNNGYDIDGTGINNFLISGSELDYSDFHFYHWNGNKWSKECSNIPPSGYRMKYANNCFIATAFYMEGFCNYFKFTKK